LYCINEYLWYNCQEFTLKAEKVIDNMKTIKTLAGEIGVTKQAIFQKMKKEPLVSSLNEFTTRVGGIVYVYPEGEGMIKEQFHKMPQVLAMPRVDDDIMANILQQQIDRKDRQLEVLNLQISVKDKQIEELGVALTIAQEQTKTAQALHAGDIHIHTEIVEKMLLNQKEPRKKGFWKKRK